MSYAYTVAAEIQEISTDVSRLKYLLPASLFNEYFTVRLGTRKLSDPPSTPLKMRDVLLSKKDAGLLAQIRVFLSTGQIVLVTIEESAIISVSAYVPQEEPDQPAIPASDSQTWGKIMSILSGAES